MKRIIILSIIAMGISYVASAQKFISKTGKISFYSATPVENIEAHNKQVNVALDAATGEFVFKVLMKSFEFEKALMQEHFNENYVESDKYPNATFQGKVTNIKDVNFNKNGSYNVTVEGSLSIHGVTKKVNHKGTLSVESDKLLAKAVFNVKLSDYQIKIPGAVTQNIAENIEISVDANLNKINK